MRQFLLLYSNTDLFVKCISAVVLSDLVNGWAILIKYVPM